MGFTIAANQKRSTTTLQEIRFSIQTVNKDGGLSGRVRLPSSVIAELGWADDAYLNVLVGDGEDAGWFCLQVAPTETKKRPRFSISDAGVGEFATSLLVPAGTEGPVKVFEPEAKIEDGALYLKLAA